ncbi:MAG: alanyl-tRNA editing protein [Lachnospiraceae bacterium]|nr:alanyl-tRNA editing protein [Lachnospiraceae bacterium]
MTEKLYHKDSHLHTFQAQVLSCEPGKNGFQVVLNATAFFPEGGGQAADRGMLDSVHVLDVHEKQGIIYHTTDKPLSPDSTVTGVIDWDLRFDRMQQHSGEHLISGLVHQKFGYDNVGFHLGDQEVTLDFNGSLTRENLLEIEWAANQAVAANFPVEVSYPCQEELASLLYRSKIEIQGQVRIVSFPGYDTCACCAPHVNRTGEIGLIKVTHVQSHRGGVRVNILCGLRALKDYREKDASVKEISVLLSAKEALVAEAVSRLKEEQFTTRGRCMALQEKLLFRELESLPEASENLSYFFADLDANALREFVNQLMARCEGYCAAFLGNDETGYRYIIGSRTQDIRPLGKALHKAFKGRGGGKPEMIQGSLPATQSQILDFLKEA